MTLKIHPLDHVALLVSCIEDTLERLRGQLGEESWDRLGLPELKVLAADIQEFPGEGTRELYLGEEPWRGRLLLMEPLGPTGPYARALARRGPGLHHLALEVPEAVRFAESARGWLVHPASLRKMESSGTLWLARPGVGTLLEVLRSKSKEEEGGSDYSLVEYVEVAVSPLLESLLPLNVETVPVTGVVASLDGGSWITLDRKRLRVADLVAEKISDPPRRGPERKNEDEEDLARVHLDGDATGYL
jgi:catechol 2,3-dioxygenase-like lactoylglutathione lyase family enzyme